MEIGFEKKSLDSRIFLSLATKALSFALSFITIPISLRYLGQETYGIWLTLFGIVNWINFFDLGLGHGLRNKLSEAIASNQIQRAVLIIRTGYSSIFLITSGLLLVLLPLIYSLNWPFILNTKILSNEILLSLITFLTIYVFISFFLNLIKPILYAFESPQYVGYLSIIQQVIFITTILIIEKRNIGNIVTFSHVYGASMIISALIISVIFFTKYKKLIPRKISFEGIKETGILNLGISFFIIQISLLILQSSDNIIITRYLSPKEVVPYSLALKLFTAMNVFYGAIFLNSLRSSITFASTAGDTQTLFAIRKRIIIGFLIALTLNLLIYMNMDLIIDIWINNQSVIISIKLKNLMLLYSFVLVWNGSFIVYLNALSELKGQLGISIFQAIINIPLSILLIKQTALGSSGVILATILCLLPMSIYAPIKIYKLKC